MFWSNIINIEPQCRRANISKYPRCYFYLSFITAAIAIETSLRLRRGESSKASAIAITTRKWRAFLLRYQLARMSYP